MQRQPSAAVDPQLRQGPSPEQLSRSFLALSSLRLRSHQFGVCLLIFTTILWGSLARGAFYQLGLVVFLVLAVAAAAAAVVLRRGRLHCRR